MRWSTVSPTVLSLSTQFRRGSRFQSTQAISLNYEEFKSKPNDRPLILAHGMLGSSSNWTSIAKAIHRKTGRHVVTFDARNHGLSPHTNEMSYYDMAADLSHLVQNQLQWDKATFVGHSMGGRTVMLSALQNPELVDKLVVVDISPVNQTFDESDPTEWNMAHFFHAMLAVEFPQDVPISQARKDADKQLAKRIKDPMLRAWLLMNVMQDEHTQEIRWKINVNAIYEAFKKHIAKFPNCHGKKFQGPTLFIGGSESDYICVSDHDEIKETFPKAQFKYIPKAGHWVHSQKPAEFIEVLLNFTESS